MNLIPISSPDDSRLDPFRRIKGQSVRADGTFVAESEIVLERLFASSIVVRAVLITPARAERLHEFFEKYLTDDQRGEVLVFTAPQPLVDEVVGYPLHRGVIALAERPVLPDAATLISTAKTLVVLEHVMDPENVGTVFRHAAGFGVDAVLLHGTTGDPLYRKTIRTSMGWTLGIPYARTSSDVSLTSFLSSAGFTTVALTPAPSSSSLAEVVAVLDDTTRVAFLLGAEGPGLQDATMAASTYRVRIPLAGGVDSLNVATAAAIALYALVEAQPSRLNNRN
jgi:tRNA G18 (ribose-2'-O)-methylase SpoU